MRGSRATLRKHSGTLHQERDNIRHFHAQPDCDSFGLKSATYAEVVEACGDSRELHRGLEIHAHISRKGLGDDTFLGNKLVEMYVKCGALADARETLHKIRDQTVKTWTVSIAAYSQNGYHREAILLFREMQQNGLEPDKVAIVTALGACACCESLPDGEKLHSHAIELGFELNSIVRSALINMYGKCGKLDAASHVFGKLDSSHVGLWSSMISALSNSTDHVSQAPVVYRRMQLGGVKPDCVTLGTCLKACTMKSDLREGRELHQQILESGLESEIIISNALVNMYGKSGSPEDASLVFSRIQRPNVISWTSIIGTYAQYKHLGRESMMLFQRMQLEGVRPNKVTMVAVLRACDSAREGRQVHGLMKEAGVYLEITVGNALVDMYCKCGALEDAEFVLRSMPKRDVISWNVMISGNSQFGSSEESLRCLWKMLQDGFLPTRVTYATLLTACSGEEDLAEGRAIHRSVVDLQLHEDEVVKSFLLGMYGKCGSLEEVRRSSARVADKNTIAWNTIIGALARFGSHHQAFHCFQQMQLEGVKTDAVSFVILFGACNSSLSRGRALHGWLLQLGFDSLITRNALIAMYSRCGALAAAQEEFDNIPSRTGVSWNSMISAYIHHGCFPEALLLFRKMIQEGLRPDEATCMSMIEFCTRKGAGTLEQRWLIDRILTESGFKQVTSVANALIVMHSKLGDLQAAAAIFSQMPEPNTVSWNSLIAAHVEKGMNKQALKLFWEMSSPPDSVSFIAALDACSNLAELQLGKQVHRFMRETHPVSEQDLVVATALINMYGKCGSLEQAREIFEGMNEKQRDVVNWGSLIVAYAQNNDCEQAMKLARRMEQDGVRADHVVFLSLISGCGHSGLLEPGCRYFASMVDDYGLTPGVEHFTCMTDVLGRAGHLDAAERLIERLASICDCKVWITLLAACRMHDKSEQRERAVRAAQRVFQLDPGNPAAYVVLSNFYSDS